MVVHLDASDARLRRWHSQLWRAVEKARPDYFAWSPQRRDRYGARIPATDLRALRRILLGDEAVRGECSSGGALATVPAELASDERRRWDEMLLPLRGIGADCFYLDEVLNPSPDRTVADFETVRELDESVCRFQHTPPMARDVTPGLRPYCGALYFHRAQLYVDGRFNYASLSMTAGYIYSRLSDCWRKLLHERIPYHYVRGKRHGELSGKHRLWDMRMVANGQERIVEELQRRIWSYQWKCFDMLLASWDAKRRSCVYLLRDDSPAGDELHIVFSDKDALEKVRFRSFVQDCRAIEADAGELSAIMRQEEAMLGQFIDEQHLAVLRMHDSHD